MEPKWLEMAREEIGTKEVPGPKSNPRIEAYYAEAGHPGLRDDVAWCAALVGCMLKRSGLPNTGSLAARSYLNYGTKLDEPRLGCIVVFKRSNSSWEGHVGFYVGETANHIKVCGGNQSDSVSIASYPKSKLLPGGYRWPVEPTATALAAAGSTEIKSANNVQNAVIAVGGATSAVKIVDESGAIDQLKSVGEGAGVIKHAMEGLHGVVKFATANLWIVILVGCIGLYLVNRQRIKARIAKHMAGIPIFGGK